MTETTTNIPRSPIAFNQHLYVLITTFREGELAVQVENGKWQLDSALAKVAGLDLDRNYSSIDEMVVVYSDAMKSKFAKTTIDAA